MTEAGGPADKQEMLQKYSLASVLNPAERETRPLRKVKNTDSDLFVMFSNLSNSSHCANESLLHVCSLSE